MCLRLLIKGLILSISSTEAVQFCMGYGHFCSLDQTHSECESAFMKIMSFRPRNHVKTTKKGFPRNLGLNSAGISGFNRAARLFFVCSTSVQTSMTGRVPPTI